MANKTPVTLNMFVRQGMAVAYSSTKKYQSLSLLLKSSAGSLRSFHGQEVFPLRCFSTEKHEQRQVDEVVSVGADSSAFKNNSVKDVETNKKLLAEVEKLTKDLTAEKENSTDLLDKYRRSLADSENLRVRLNKQISDAKIFGIQGFCKDLLEVADTLGHATEAVPKDKLTENSDLKNLYDGLTMTRASLLQVFKRHGLEPLNPINEKFDPNFHEALFQKEDPNVEPNTIVEVTKLGYKLHERCIRPALVGVSKC